MEEAVSAEWVDDGVKRDVRGRRRYSREHVDALLVEFGQSGMSQAAFARRAGVMYQTFAGWVRTRRICGSATDKPVVFAEVRMAKRASGEDASLSVHLPDGLVVRGREVEAVAALVRSLRA